MIERFKQEKTSYKIFTMAVLAAAIFFVCRIVYAGILALPYPKELLEASNVALTETFLAGRSPTPCRLLIETCRASTMITPSLTAL